MKYMQIATLCLKYCHQEQKAPRSVPWIQFVDLHIHSVYIHWYNLQFENFWNAIIKCLLILHVNWTNTKCKDINMLMQFVNLYDTKWYEIWKYIILTSKRCLSTQGVLFAQYKMPKHIYLRCILCCKLVQYKMHNICTLHAVCTLWHNVDIFDITYSL